MNLTGVINAHLLTIHAHAGTGDLQRPPHDAGLCRRRAGLRPWGWPVHHTAPSANPDVGNYVVFLHGGGYINEIVRAHWRFIGYLTRNARVCCVVPIYPLAPRATAKDIVPATGNLWRKLLENVGPAKVTWIVNSA